MTESAAHVHLEETTPWVRRWLRLEGLTGLAAGLAAWLWFGGEPLWFLVFLFVPDLSMVGYLKGPHPGAITYNVAHNWFIGGLALAAGALWAVSLLGLAGAVLVAHTGIDRLLGYGLKYPTSFQDTHLGRIGRRANG